MKNRCGAFNLKLWGLAALAVLATGCQTEPVYTSKEDSPDTQLTALRIHVEGAPDSSGRTVQVPVFRERPILVTVDREPFLTEGNVTKAEVVDEPGGFSLRIEFERQGRWLLEKYTGQYRGRRLAIFASFGSERWIGAPLIQAVISDGKFTFTPDASREEALRIARGLNNYAKKMEHDPRF